MRNLIFFVILAGTISGTIQRAHAGGAGWRPFRYAHYDRGANWFNANRSWHGPHYNNSWGHPVAVIVPPVANFQTNYAWGVARSRMAPIHHQFGRPYVDPVTGVTPYSAPMWPSDTTHLGYYSVRGPW
jgi:hypothetical protein